MADADLVDWLEVVARAQPNWALPHPFRSDIWGDEVQRLLLEVRRRLTRQVYQG